MEGRLQLVLGFVNDWLRFAEAKNAALLAANSAIVFGLLRSLVSLQSLPAWVSIYLYVAIGAIGVSAALSMLSFVPRIRLPWIAATRRPSAEDNLLFYGDITGYGARSYLEALYQRSAIEPPEVSDLEEDYAEQIIVNSRIALMKYRFFAFAAWITLSALLTPAITVPLLILRRSE